MSGNPNLEGQLLELAQRYNVSESIFFSFRDFRERARVEVGLGLCAGLVRVWWAELRKGNNAMQSLKAANPSLTRNVLLSQARSMYLKRFPLEDADLNASERALLTFKYGDVTLSELRSVQDLFAVRSEFELDLVLHHGLPIVERRESVDTRNDLTIPVRTPRPCLYLLLFRYADSTQASGERGHRSGLVVHADGGCNFYDPRIGETVFPSIKYFSGWLAEYLDLQGWQSRYQRLKPGLASMKIYAFGGRLAPPVNEKRIALERRFWRCAPQLQ